MSEQICCKFDEVLQLAIANQWVIGKYDLIPNLCFTPLYIHLFHHEINFIL